MTRKLYFFIVAGILLIAGCVKETYDMEKLSKKAHISPLLSLNVFKGDVSLLDIIKENDTVIVDNDKFVKLVFRKDSVINLKLKSFYSFEDMVSFSQSYAIGELTLAPFQGTLGFSLNDISLHFSTALRNNFVALDNGALHPFPAFPSVNLGSKSFPVFTNFQNAVFSSGFLDISVTNNLTAPLSGLTFNLVNTSGLSPIGDPISIPLLQPGQRQTVSISLSGLAITNSISASVTLSGSAGNPTPVLISLNNSDVQFTIAGRDLKIKSGRAIIQSQIISTPGNSDIVNFNPGAGVELEKIKIITGNLSWHVSSTSSLYASVNLAMSSVLRNGVPLTESINAGSLNQFYGDILFNNTVISLNSDPAQPFNKVPFNYTINVTSNNIMVNFNSTDMIQLDLKLLNPEFDYVKGYFGQQVEPIGLETVDFGIKDILKKVSGEFFVTSPSIRFNYSNSFEVPMEVALNGQGIKGDQVINLGLAPFEVSHPGSPVTRDISSSFSIDKNNSSLAELISMPPEEITFSGSAKMNPAGDPNHLRDNYVFGNSRFLGSVELEIPMEFRFNDFVLEHTFDNFMNSEENSQLKPEDFELLQFEIKARNGFPLGVSLSISLSDSASGIVKSTIVAADVLKAAPVDANGKVNGVTETNTLIEFSKEFISNFNKADQIIFHFTLNTTGKKDIKIYSDYRIDFSAAIIAKPDIKF